MVRRMRTFEVTSGMSCGTVLVVAAFANSSTTPLPGMPLWPGTQVGVVGPVVFSSRWLIYWGRVGRSE